ncbi:MAG: hypothetical protein U1F71_24685 [Verrucomicrobiaceae bacterium]
MTERPKQCWGILQWGIVIGIVSLLGLWAVPTYIDISRKGNETWGVNYCMQVNLAMKQFSKDNGGLYPDGGPSAAGLTSSNQVFRRLFQTGVMTEETVFGCPGSQFIPDRNIGAAPDFRQALEPGECHWILLKHQDESSPGNAPVIVENALDTNWPPRWDVSDQAGNRKGRAREGRQIIVAFNDGSAQVVKLQDDGSLNGDFWNRIFTPEQAAKLSYWDIEEK